MNHLDDSKTNSVFISGALMCFVFLFLLTLPVATAITWNIDHTTVISNSTEFWITSLGSLGDANTTQFIDGAFTLSINNSWLENFGSGLYCQLVGGSGCSMVGDIRMNDNNIQGIDKAYFNSGVFISSDDSEHLDIHADYIDLHGNLSTIWNVRLNTNGNGSVGPSQGNLVFGSGGGRVYLYSNGSDFLIEPDALGSGDVVILGNIRADYFIGDGSLLTNLNLTTETTDGWIINSFDGGILNTTFNQSQLSIQFFNVSTIDVITGTPAGTIGDIQSYNNIPYNVSEVGSDLELRVNFTGVEDFNELIVRYKSEEEDLAHTLVVQIYDVGSSTWEEYGTLPGTSHYHIVEFGVFDSDEHIDGDGVVQVRFFQDEGVPPRTHLHNFDWVTISKGFGTPSGEEVDPDSIHKDGDVPWMGNENGNQFNTTNWDWGFFNVINVSGNITANTIFGTLNESLWEIVGGDVVLKTPADVDLKDKILKVDHIAESTGEHNVVFDDSIEIQNIFAIDGVVPIGIIDTAGTKTFTAGASDYFDLGTSLSHWKDLHLSGDANIGGDILLGDGDLTTTGNVTTPQITDSSTAIAIEIDNRILNDENGNGVCDFFTGNLFDCLDSNITTTGLGTFTSGSSSATIHGLGSVFQSAGDTRKVILTDLDWTIDTIGPSRLQKLLVEEANDGGDTNIIISNTAASGSSDETVSLIAKTTTDFWDSMGKIVFGREDNYGINFAAWSSMKFYTTTLGIDTLAMTIDKNQDITMEEDLSVGGDIYISGKLNVSENATFEKDVIIEGTLFGGSPLKISGGINVSNGNVYLNVGDFIGSGLITPNMSGAYGIGVDTLSLIGGSKTTLYGGIGGGGGKISLQGGRGRDAAHNPSSYAPILLQSNGGNVGIGTTSPDSILHIKADIAGTVGSHSAGQLIIQNPTDSVFSNAVITGYESDGDGDPDQQLWYFGSSSGSNSNVIFLNRRNALLQLGTNGSAQMTILGNGNVGIGTTSPTHKLNVIGDLNITGNYIINGSTGFTGNCVNASYVGGIAVSCND